MPISALRRDQSRSSLAEALERSLSEAYWLAETDALAVLLVRDAVAERDALRGDGIDTLDPAGRRALRALDKEIAALLSLLGLDPRSRARFGAIVTPAEPASKLDQLRARHNRGPTKPA